MTTQVITKEETKTDVTTETSKFAIGTVITMASLIGIWAVACLVGGLYVNGLGDTIRGFISAVTGS